MDLCLKGPGSGRVGGITRAQRQANISAMPEFPLPVPPFWLAPDPSRAVQSALPRLRAALDSGRPIRMGDALKTDAIPTLVAALRDRPVVGVRVAGCASAADVVLALGWTLETTPPGDERAVRRRLARWPEVAVVLVEADTTCIAAAPALRALAPEARWIWIGEGPPPPPSDLESWGMDALELPADPPLGALPAFAPQAAVLCRVPAGTPAFIDLPAAICTPGPPDRLMLPARIRAHLSATAPLLPEPAAEVLQSVHRATLAMAVGAPIEETLRWEDALALQWMSCALSGPIDAARAAAAAARARAAWGQLGAARDILFEATGRLGGEPVAAAILEWADALCRLRAGDEQRALQVAGWASTTLEQAGQPGLQAALHRELGEARAVRGAIDTAGLHLRTARALHDAASSGRGVSVCLRATADLAVSCGETLSAAALYDQAESWHATPIELTNRSVSRASLALTRGDLPRAGTLLANAPEADMPPVLTANHLRRCADLSLRGGEYDRADQLAAAACVDYHRVGELCAAGHTTRLRGDIAAAAGERRQADAFYRDAMRIQLQVSDHRGLLRTLRHAQVLACASGDAARARRYSDVIGDLGE